MTAAAITRTPLIILIPSILVALIPSDAFPIACSSRNPARTSSARLRTTSLHQQNRLLQPQKGGIVVESPPNGFVVRDVLLDLLLGRDGNDRDDEPVLLGGVATTTTFSPRSGAASSSATTRNAASLPPFPNLKYSNASGAAVGPRRMSPAESAVFERSVAVDRRADARSRGGGDSSAPRSAGGSAARFANASSDRRGGGRTANDGFRNGTGRDYSSSVGAGFASIGGTSGGRSGYGVSIKGDSSIFRSTGFMNGNDVVRTGGVGGVGYAASPPASTKATSYDARHYFDAAASANGGYGIPSSSKTSSDRNSQPQRPSFSVGSGNGDALRPTSPRPTKYTSGRSLGDNFLSASRSVKRSHYPDEDDDQEFDPDMPGYESPTRRGEGFLTAPDPSYANRPVHSGKWIGELYAERGLDVLSGGMEGFGAVMGEMGRGGSSGGGSPGGARYGNGGDRGMYGGGNGNGNSMTGYGGEVGYGNGVDSGYGSDDGYGSGSNGYGGDNGYQNSNNGYGSDNGYGDRNTNRGYRTGGDVGLNGFRGAPPQGY